MCLHVSAMYKASIVINMFYFNCPSDRHYHIFSCNCYIYVSNLVNSVANLLKQLISQCVGGSKEKTGLYGS